MISHWIFIVFFFYWSILSLFLFISAPSFIEANVDFVLDTTTSNVDASWQVTDDCGVKTGFTVTGYKTADTTSTVSVTADADATTAEMAFSTFEQCAEYVFDITMDHTAAGAAIVSTRTTTGIIPNTAGTLLYHV